jgi:hypothetical protein
MSSKRVRMAVIGLLIVLALGFIVYSIWQSSRLSLGVKLEKSAGQLAYLDFDSNGANLFMLDTVSGNITQLTTNHRITHAVMWRDEGESLVLPLRDNKRSELILVSGTLKELPAPESYSQTISPNKTLLVSDNCSPTSGTSGWDNSTKKIMIADANHSNPRQIANGCYPSWSPDSQQIVFSSQESGDIDAEVYIMNTDGSNLHRLLVHPGPDAVMSWSPDGKHIVFENLTTYSDGKTHKEDLYTVDVDGQNLTKIDSLSRFNILRWSPDGQTLLYLSDADTLCFVKADGSDRFCRTEVSSIGDWSPDGKLIAYKQRGQGPVCIFDTSDIVDTVTRDKRCFPGTENAMFLSWRP